MAQFIFSDNKTIIIILCKYIFTKFIIEILIDNKMFLKNQQYKG